MKRKLLLGVTGSIAAYKSADLARRLVDRGIDVRVVMTSSATRFITPLTFQTLLGGPVYTDLFGAQPPLHIPLAKWADLFLIAPATADVIGKIAAGVADELLTAVVLAARCPILLVPSMNAAMYGNVVFQENKSRLERLDFKFIEPDYGALADGTKGRGRFPEIERIVEKVVAHFSKGGELAGKTILVTAGPTQEPLDPVRFISNPSSGKMGFCIAEVSKGRGARVVLISGPVCLKPPSGVELINVRTAGEMMESVCGNFEKADVLIMASAVSDYRPSVFSGAKLKKGSGQISLKLEETEDILRILSEKKGKRVLVGFSADTEKMEESALSKLKHKNLDLIVANNILEEGAGFGADTNIVKLIDSSGSIESLPRLSKEKVAERVLDKVSELFKTQ